MRVRILLLLSSLSSLFFCGCYSTGRVVCRTVRKNENFNVIQFLFYTCFVARIKTSWGSFCVSALVVEDAPRLPISTWTKKLTLSARLAYRQKKFWRTRDQQTATDIQLERLERKIGTSSSHQILDLGICERYNIYKLVLRHIERDKLMAGWVTRIEIDVGSKQTGRPRLQSSSSM